MKKIRSAMKKVAPLASLGVGSDGPRICEGEQSRESNILKLQPKPFVGSSSLIPSVLLLSPAQRDSDTKSTWLTP